MKLYKALIIAMLLITTLAFPWGSELCQGCRIDSSALAGPIYTFPDSQLFQQMISTNGTFLFQDAIDRLPVYSNGIKLEIRTQSKSPLRLAYDVNNYVDFSVGASGGLTINATGGVVISSNGNLIIRNGNVGIGTASPVVKLDVVGNAIVRGIDGFDATGEKAILYIGDTNAHIDSVYNYGLRFTPSAVVSDSVVIDVSGRVGIGTTDPGAYKLKVNGKINSIGDIDASGDIYFTGATPTIYGASKLYIRSGAGESLFLGSNNVNGKWTLDSSYNVTQAGNLIVQGTGNTTIAGNVGIGTTAPDQKLTIAGMIHFNDGTVNGYVGPQAWVSNAFSIGTAASYPLVFATNSTEHMRITSAGNVHVGPSTAYVSDKFTVSGTWENSTLKNGQTLDSAGPLGVAIINRGASYQINKYFGITFGVNSTTDANCYNFAGIYAYPTNIGNAVVGDIVFATGDGIYLQDTRPNTEKMRLTSGGNVGIGTPAPGYKLTVVGTAWVTSGTWSGSDRRWKKDITPIQDSLKKVTQLQGINYYWKNQEFPEQHFTTDKQIGLIAQDTEKIIPEVVTTGQDGYKGICYEKLVPMLVEAIKELKSKNESDIIMLKDEKDAEIARKNVEINKLNTNYNNLKQEIVEIKRLLTK